MSTNQLLLLNFLKLAPIPLRGEGTFEGWLLPVYFLKLHYHQTEGLLSRMGC